MNKEYSVEELEKMIDHFEHRVRYSKNPMEQRQLRSQIGKLQRELRDVKLGKYDKTEEQ